MMYDGEGAPRGASASAGLSATLTAAHKQGLRSTPRLL